MKLLIIGSARHGKDTVAEFINKHFGMTFQSSSLAASEIFIYDTLKEKYNYDNPEQCFEDRVNHRAEWYELIKEYNVISKTKLAREILKKNDMYVGMREHTEIQACKDEQLFDYIIGVFDPRKPEEPKDSFNINIWEESDFVIPNSQGLEELEQRVIKIITPLLAFEQYKKVA
ncbi:MAG: hypothetical protein KC414_13040 [Romboutsia sp.]|nr:hypothetical protein [Romboutsia sp.]